MNDIYHPDTGPLDLEEWQQLDEGEQQLLVIEAHTPLGPDHPPVPEMGMHAMFHVVGENQLLLDHHVGEEVRKALGRFEQAGIARHEATHAVASVLAEYLFELVKAEDPSALPAEPRYLQGLRELSPESWRASAQPSTPARRPPRARKRTKRKNRRR